LALTIERLPTALADSYIIDRELGRGGMATVPYVQGESLRERLEREKQLPVDEAVFEK